MIPDFDDRLEAAIKLAESFSGFSKFHDSYRPLFRKLWLEVDPEQTCLISATKAERFAAGMVAGGWKDWAPSARERGLWAELDTMHGGITLEQFAEISENDIFVVPDVEDGSDDDDDDDHHGKRKPQHRSGGARSKAEAGRMLTQNHAERMKDFSMPDESIKVKRHENEFDPQDAAYCDGCIDQSMCQQCFCGPCRQCHSNEVTSDQAFCCACGLELGRCSGCACCFEDGRKAPVQKRKPGMFEQFE